MQNPASAEAYFERSESILSKVFDKQFSYMSENERLGFLNEQSGYFPAYLNFATTYAKKQPELIGKMYDLLLWVKGMVASSVRAQRARLVASGDTRALYLLDQLTSKKTQVAALHRTQPADRQQWQTMVDRLEHDADELEKELDKRSDTFAESRVFARPAATKLRRERYVQILLGPFVCSAMEISRPDAVLAPDAV